MDNIQKERAQDASDDDEDSGTDDEDQDSENEEEEEEDEFSAAEESEVPDDQEGEDEEAYGTGTAAEDQDADSVHKSREPPAVDSARKDGFGEAVEHDAAEGEIDGQDGSPSGADSPRSAGSRSPSPSTSLANRAGAMSVRSQRPTASGSKDISERVQTEVAKQRARQQRKYHSKKGAQRTGGRPKGSKRKQDTRVKMDSGWD